MSVSQGESELQLFGGENLARLRRPACRPVHLPGAGWRNSFSSLGDSASLKINR